MILKHTARKLRGARAQGGHGSGSEPWDADSEDAPDAVAVSQQGSVGALSDAGAGAAAAAAAQPDERACRCAAPRRHGVGRACCVITVVVLARLNSHHKVLGVCVQRCCLQPRCRLGAANSGGQFLSAPP